MSTPDQPETPRLTRRQLRELRNTASNPIITPDSDPPADTAPPAAPLPRAAEPADIAEPPVADDAVDLNAPALTRREARLQEKLRTASVPVIIPAVDADAPAPAEAAQPTTANTPLLTEPDDAAEPVAEVVAPATPMPEPEDTRSPAPAAGAEPAPTTEVEPDKEAGPAEDDAAVDQADEPEPVSRVLGAAFGADLLAGAQPSAIELPPSFDQLLARGTTTTGSLSVPNALILSQTPEAGSLVSPITATGEVLITGAFSLPENYGATGRAPGTSDGKEVDATLVDGELPPASSPTPIAASAAISTIKSADDIIKPPAPEKGSRLMMALAITAGVLALALAGVLIVALVTGVLG